MTREAFKTALIEIWLPTSFKSVKKSELENFKPGLSIVELLLESDSETPIYRNLALIAYQPLNGESVESFLEREMPSVSENYVVTSRRKVSINAADVTVITIETRLGGMAANMLAYIYVDGGTVWYVAYAAEITQYYTSLADFEKSAKTFRVVR